VALFSTRIKPFIQLEIRIKTLQQQKANPICLAFDT